MKKLIILFCLWMLFAHLWGQQIIQAEYFTGEDPGFGKGTAIVVTAGSEAEMSFNIPLGSLDFGLNILYSRVKDSDGVWSQTFHRVFLKQALTLDTNLHITEIEYFFDEDPGFGKATPILFQAGAEISIAVVLPLQTLTNGIHSLYVRTRDNKGSWSMISNRTFLVQMITKDAHQVNQMEYFFDEDPGFGLATPIEFQSGAEISVAVNLPLENLSDGIHTLYVRTSDDKGSWGMAFLTNFLKFSTPVDQPLVTRMEYFVNTDPGAGNGTKIEMNTPKQTVMKYFVIDPENFQVGTNTLYIRTLDNRGRWGIVYYTDFEVLQTEPCNPPSDLSATDVTETTASLGWTSQGTSWDLMWVPDGYDYTEDAELSTGIPDNPHSIDGLMQSKPYDFYVRTICSDGQVSPWAGPGIFHTLPLNTYQVTLLSNPPEGGTMTGEGTYSSGATVSITATPSTNFEFQYWSGNTGLLADFEAESTTFTMPAEPVTLTAHFLDVTGISVIQGRRLKLFPNPCRNEFWVEFNNLNNHEGIIRLLNMQGQVVAQKDIEATNEVRISFNTSNLNPGVYMLYLQSENWQVVRKVIVNP